MSVFRRATTTTLGAEVSPPSYEDAAAAILNASVSDTRRVIEAEGDGQAVEGQRTIPLDSSQTVFPSTASETAGRYYQSNTAPRTTDDVTAPSTDEPTTLSWRPPVDKETSGLLKFIFSKFSFNSILVIPSADSTDSKPQYHISVDIDVFCPTSWTTTIRRGSSEVGEYVGEFRTGSTEPSLVRVGSRLSTFATALKARRWTSRTRYHYVWQLMVDRDLYWIPELDEMYGRTLTGNWTCYLCKKGDENERDSVPLANYTSEQNALRPNRISPSLQVRQDGIDALDHIVVSLLLCEDMRLRPKLK